MKLFKSLKFADTYSELNISFRIFVQSFQAIKYFCCSFFSFILGSQFGVGSSSHLWLDYPSLDPPTIMRM